MYINSKQKEVLSVAFDDCLRSLIDDMLKYKKSLIETVEVTDFKYHAKNEDFEELSESGFLFRLESYYKHHNNIHTEMRKIKDILEDSSNNKSEY